MIGVLRIICSKMNSWIFLKFYTSLNGYGGSTGWSGKNIGIGCGGWILWCVSLLLN